MAKEPVRIAAVAAAAGFLVQAAFQAAIALGAPLGRASWGGAYDGQLPMGLRIASGVTAGVYVLAALIVLGRGGVRGVPLPYGVLRWGTWVLAGLLFVGALPNFASSSGCERFGWGPLALIQAVLCLFVALRAEPVSREAEGGPRSLIGASTLYAPNLVEGRLPKVNLALKLSEKGL
jgi:hypothetical protein